MPRLQKRCSVDSAIRRAAAAAAPPLCHPHTTVAIRAATSIIHLPVGGGKEKIKWFVLNGWRSHLFLKAPPFQIYLPLHKEVLRKVTYKLFYPMIIIHVE